MIFAYNRYGWSFVIQFLSYSFAIISREKKIFIFAKQVTNKKTENVGQKVNKWLNEWVSEGQKCLWGAS